MSKPETIMIDDQRYVREDVAARNLDGPVKIVILQRGWVMVGRLERDGSDCALSDASVVRKWGTKRGLGEIAAGGPTKDTVLDKCHGIVEFDWLTVVAAVSCEESKWASVL